MVRAVHDLDDIAIDTARRNAHLGPSLALYLGRALHGHQRPLLRAELRQHGLRQVARHV